MLTQEQIQERNAHLMNTEPGTRIILSHSNPDLWAGATILVEYNDYFPGSEMFRVVHPQMTSGLFVYEENCDWDFEVYDA